MNVSVWSNAFEGNYQHNRSGTLDSSIRTHLNASSGYESASNDTSLVETYVVAHARIEQTNVINDYENQSIEDEELMGDNDEHYHGTKRRMLSRKQREEANRRERHRMEIINQAYEDLRNVLPCKKGRKRQKMSRMDTVDGAIQYIHILLEILHGLN
ncbi:unnamed protein product [Rotaria magnacalcarata]|uniref:BHLH domain-containing protein n=1 Tax=Rotaria magnacalcarata TaxID=392030 RepID=A0A816VNU7_9BILA|nr:unnamed protein product [Rotaria magnacalcarata]CAF4427778.1 unnamed protein product [Rotaria magnacalcarata]